MKNFKKISMFALAGLMTSASMVMPVMADTEEPVAPGDNLSIGLLLEQIPGQMVFHLDDTFVRVGDDTSGPVSSYNAENNVYEANIGYHITVTAGNYYEDNKNAYMIINAESAELSDLYGSSQKPIVSFESDSKTVNKNITVTDSATYAGSIKMSVTKPSQAGLYSGSTNVIMV